MPSATSDEVVEQRILEAYARGGSRVVVTAWASLRLHRGGFFDGLARDGHTRLPVPLAASGDRIGTNGHACVVEDHIPPDEVVTIHGMRCATVHRALFDEMRRLRDVEEAAVAIGSACAAQLTSVARMKRYVESRYWYRDVRMCRQAVEMAVEECRSPQEDRFRLFWEYGAGWGRPLINRAIYDEHGTFVAIPDLLDPVRGVVGEYAGADHRDIDQHEKDIVREANVRDVGLEYVEVVGRDFKDDERIKRRMRQAELRARNLTRRWVLGPAPAITLDQILDRRDAA